MPRHTVTTGRAFDRFIGFSDSITAVAITLLALPLVGIGAPDPGENVWTVISRNSGAIWAFFITFAVVGTMWRGHARVFQSIRGYDHTMFMLNLAWLALIVLLPWPATLYGQSGNAVHATGESLPGAGLFYWLVLAATSMLLSAMSIHAARTPGLTEEGQSTPPHAAAVRGAAFASACVVIGIVSLFAPRVAEWLPLALIPISIWTDRSRRPRSTNP